VDVASLWDYGSPEASEQRFRRALETATGDEALVLRTQVARTYGLRGDFDRARAMLDAMAAQVPAAGPEVQVRHALERGRTYASATHPPQSQTAQSREIARRHFEQARGLAREAGLDALAIDAIHMLAFLDTAPADQLRWGREALAIAEASSQPDARRWEASLRNNVGYALHRLGRFDEALEEFNRALELRRRGSDAQATRVAQWMVAWTLRALQRNDEAIGIQLRLEREADAAGRPDPHVFEELEILYRMRGDEERARHYAGRRGHAAPGAPE
jgi:tetratricopeptide (TPR) repeat protein